MKNFVIILLLSLFCFSSFAQYSINEEDILKEKIEKYSKRNKKGFSLLGAGGATLALGIFLTSEADWQTETTATGVNYHTDDPGGMVGVIAIAGGAAMTITGIILAANGSKNLKKYQKKLDQLSFGMMYTPKASGFTLVYRF